ncbi:motility protein MotB [Pseudomonas sp. Choline-3u-10]|jgi:chemotaxis protein MotB|uniref:flagellar motor protein MotB n=1 Tax=Pseudomonadaceae TaxID=135621 RepID=UPI000C321915|nr:MULTISPECIES: flagellar motor protein MotB [Pseudomonadaceae]MAL37807.1 motility protein MotB [Pseudomonas sp.]MBU0949215.1 flagellar motor protein MotB [Gammaproteobacteria bacterium]MBK3793695.1 flagellar motor protein MotB [Stutzerimonas stutzeri]MBK3875185.1 flagellar motor protein MotB [Stutzerimonas stutzeri]PKG94880.1 motility protein MotB [Pseudomonas sp. Choline-3u-10]|tara:strand:+ start:2281 stop:3291 length:1011 start_codon:yes stop_codon:yes gene_type:complete
MDNTQPIIVKRIKKVAAGHHGGAWKIAFADFATAMMAFFMVMWLMSSATPEQKRAISGYFQDPIGFTESASPHVIDLGGTPTPAPDRTLNDVVDPAVQQTDAAMDAEQAETFAEQLERERLDLLLQELQNKVDENPELTRFKDQILFEITQDGLRIQIMDAANRPMFALGSAQLQPYFEDILLAMADTIRAVPNKISVSGHTDAKPYSGRGEFGNWELSAGRANAARRALVAGSYPEEQIARVVGYASSALFDREDPLNPVNRRIDILVLTKKAQRDIEGEQSDATGKDAASEPTSAGDTSAPSAAPSAPLQAPQLRERLNIFEDGVLQFDQPGGN